MRLERLTQLVAEAAQTWSMAPVVEAYQAMRGVSLITAVTFVAEIGDVQRFENPRQLMAYLGLVPSEASTGERVRRGEITKAGNSRARRVLIEAAWSYRFPARISRLIEERCARTSQEVQQIAWKAQVRLTWGASLSSVVLLQLLGPFLINRRSEARARFHHAIG